MRRATTIAVCLAALAAAPGALAQTNYTIRAKGSTTGLGKVTAIGAFKPYTDPSLGAAVRVFGPPTSVKAGGQVSCRLGWKPLGLRIVFVNLGGGSACDPSLGKAQTGSAFGRNWRTSRGLKVRSTTRKLRRLYPNALRRGRNYRLVGGKSIFGDGRRYSVLAAKTANGRVGSFKLAIGAAGE